MWRPNCWAKMNFNKKVMIIDITEKELREIIASLSVNALRINGRINKGKKQIDNFISTGGGDDDAKLQYLGALVALRTSRKNQIIALRNRLVEIESVKQNDF